MSLLIHSLSSTSTLSLHNEAPFNESNFVFEIKEVFERTIELESQINSFFRKADSLNTRSISLHEHSDNCRSLSTKIHKMIESFEEITSEEERLTETVTSTYYRTHTPDHIFHPLKDLVDNLNSLAPQMDELETSLSMLHRLTLFLDGLRKLSSRVNTQVSRFAAFSEKALQLHRIMQAPLDGTMPRAGNTVTVKEHYENCKKLRERLYAVQKGFDKANREYDSLVDCVEDVYHSHIPSYIYFPLMTARDIISDLGLAIEDLQGSSLDRDSKTLLEKLDLQVPFLKRLAEFSLEIDALMEKIKTRDLSDINERFSSLVRTYYKLEKKNLFRKQLNSFRIEIRAAKRYVDSLKTK